MLVSAYTTAEDRYNITLRTADLELSFGRSDGALRGLRLLDGQPMLGHGPPTPSFDLALGASPRWQTESGFLRYLHHRVEVHAGAIELQIAIGIGALKIQDCYQINGTLITRRVRISNTSPDRQQLRGLRLSLPWARIGALEECQFEAPGNSVRPRLNALIAAQQRREILPRRFFAPGLRRGRALEPVPTGGHGLMALRNQSSGETLLCWWEGKHELAWPELDGNDQALHLTHRIGLEGWLDGEQQVETGAQLILLLKGDWHSAIEAFRHTRELFHPLASPGAPAWLSDGAVYEVHPAQYGSLRGLQHELPRLAELGIQTLYLMPIWLFAGSTGRPWDGNWSRSGSPYAVIDLDQIDPALGDAADLRALVEHAHELGLRVLLEFLPLRCALEARWAREHPEWLCCDEHGRPQQYGQPGDLLRGISYRFDCAHPAFQEAMIAWALRQVEHFGIDGFRIDAPLDGRPNWNPNLTHLAGAATLGLLPLLERLRQQLRSRYPEVALLISRGGPAFTRYGDATYNELSHHMFVHLALSRISPAELADWLTDDATMHTQRPPQICYTETHDTRDSNPIADGLRGSRLAHMILTGMIGCGYVPLLRAGQERGDEQFLQRLLAVRRNSQALRHGQTDYYAVPCATTEIFCALRFTHDEQILTLLNVSAHRRTVTLNLPAELARQCGAIQLHDLLSDKLWNEDGRYCWPPELFAQLELTLDPFTGYLLQIEPANTPDT